MSATGKTQRALEAAAVASDAAMERGDPRPVIFVCATIRQRHELVDRLKAMSAQRVEVISLSQAESRLRGASTFFVDHHALDTASAKQAKHLLGGSES